MEHLIQQFELPVVGSDGELYVAMVHGCVRGDRRWEATIEFRRVSDGVRLSTGVETTQGDWQAVLYWASGLGAAYFEAALGRASRSRSQTGGSRSTARAGGRGLDSTDRELEHNRIAQDVLDRFRSRNVNQLIMRELFDLLPYSDADIMRAFEFLEKHGLLVVRHTDRDNDLLVLTERGQRDAGLAGQSQGAHVADRKMRG